MFCSQFVPMLWEGNGNPAGENKPPGALEFCFVPRSGWNTWSIRSLLHLMDRWETWLCGIVILAKQSDPPSVGDQDQESLKKKKVNVQILWMAVWDVLWRTKKMHKVSATQGHAGTRDTQKHSNPVLPRYPQQLLCNESSHVPMKS